jgi:polar amino acid transport system substrate-binding protein
VSALARVLAFAILASFLSQTASADTLDDIKKRGKIVVAVKTDYPPWGYKDDKGKLKGMEIDLANDIARRLKVKLELVPAYSSTRVQLLNDHKADLILATFSVTAERKKQVYFIEPSYYAAMIGIITRTNSGIGGETSLKGRKVCAVSGNYSNPTVTKFVGGPLIEYKTLTEAEEKLRAGECDGVSFDDVVLLYQLKSDEQKWKDYDIALLLTVDPAPWGLAVRLGEQNGRFAKFLSGVVKDWHKTGVLLAKEKQWVGENSMALQWLSQKVKAAEAAKPVKPAKPAALAKPKGASKAAASGEKKVSTSAKTDNEPKKAAMKAEATKPKPRPEPKPEEKKEFNYFGR